MSVYKRYRIKADDEFKAVDFPKVISELDALLLFLSKLPATYKKEIVLSFLKKQSLHNNWTTANPDLSTAISSGILITDHLESLFDSCQQNKQFQQEYEEYIRAAIA